MKEEQPMYKLDRPLDPERDRWFLGTLDCIAARSEETGGAYGVVVRIAAKGFSPPLHQHSKEDTGVFVIDGRLRVKVGDKEEEIGPHEFRFAPRGVPHWFKVESETARFLEILSPGGFEKFHMDISDPAKRFEIPPSDHPKPNPEKMASAGHKYGSHVLKHNP
jgi:quercetin dioxygenase-like cupin family protein